MSISADRHHWGLWNSIFGRFMRLLASRLGVHVFLINSRPLNADAFLEDIPPGEEIRYLKREDLDPADKEPGLSLLKSFAEAAFERGDVCIGYFDQDQLVSYFWCGFEAVPMEAGLWVRVPPNYSYAYKALTVGSHRGRRLQQLLTNASDRELAKRGLTHNIEYIATYNFPQRVASARYGNKTIGIAGYVKWGALVRPFRSPGVKSHGFEFFEPA